MVVSLPASTSTNQRLRVLELIIDSSLVRYLWDIKRSDTILPYSWRRIHCISKMEDIVWGDNTHSSTVSTVCLKYLVAKNIISRIWGIIRSSPQKQINILFCRSAWVQVVLLSSKTPMYILQYAKASFQKIYTINCVPLKLLIY